MSNLYRDQETEATAMLLGEHTMVCSCCLGRKWHATFLVGRKRCGQCKGTGYDLLGPKTMEALGIKK